MCENHTAQGTQGHGKGLWHRLLRACVLYFSSGVTHSLDPRVGGRVGLRCERHRMAAEAKEGAVRSCTGRGPFGRFGWASHHPVGCPPAGNAARARPSLRCHLCRSARCFAAPAPTRGACCQVRNGSSASLTTRHAPLRTRNARAHALNSLPTSQLARVPHCQHTEL